MKISFYSVILIIFLIISHGCSDKYQHAIENKDELIKLSLHQDITCNDGRNYYELITYNHDYTLKNQYIFKEEKKSNHIFYSLKYDSIEFKPDNFTGLDLESNEYPANICDYYQKASKILKFYKIKSLISGEEYKSWPGLKLIIYFDKGEQIGYFPQGGANLHELNKVAEDWYLLE